eukprot:augustus_masked-scaffold_1-processed-gene-6.40-mRNA-1 protein AED:0.45 eAED:0.45 QI:0/-1/0/1/-1/1/1/0/780
MLGENRTLQTISMSKNKATIRGVKSIEEAMQVNRTLENIWGVGSDMIEILTHANKEDKKGLENDALASIMTQGLAKGKLMRSKVMFIGAGRSGKTATVNSLLGVPFEKQWKSTIGAELREGRVNDKEGWVKTDPKKMFNMSEEFAARVALDQIEEMKETIAKENNLVVAEGQNLKGETALMAVEKTQDDEEAEASFNPFKELDTEKKENEQQEVDSEDEDEDAPKSGAVKTVAMPAPMQRAPGTGGPGKVINYANVMEGAKIARDTVKFSLYDFGGQRIFYSLHHLFLTKKGVYVLLFDMRLMLREPTLCRRYLNFWLNSLALHAPETPLLILGTYMDEIHSKEDLEEINNRVVACLEKYPFANDQNLKQNFQFYPISNKTGLGVSEAKKAINRVARSQPYMQRKIPLNWTYLIESLLQSRKAYVTTTDFAVEAKGFRIYASSELNKILRLFHDLGLVLHLKQTSALAEVVTLRPDWLIRSIGRIIRDKKLHQHNMALLEEEGLEKDSFKLFNEGLLTDQFVRFMWSEERIDFLLDLMRQTLLLCDWTFHKNKDGKEQVQKMYFVPCMVTGSQDLEEYDENLDHKGLREAPRQEIDFEKLAKEEEDAGLEAKDEIYENPNLKNICFFEFSFLPDGVFDRLVCLCVGHSNLLRSEQAPVVSEEFVKISFGENIFVKLYERKAIDIIYVELEDTPESLKAGQSSLAIVQSMLQKLQGDIIGNGLSWKLFFPQSDKTYLSFEKAADAGLEPWFVDTSREEYSKRILAAEHVNVDTFLEDLQAL